MRIIILLFFVQAFINISYAAYCVGKPGVAHNNTLPIWDESPRLLKQVKNGKLYEIGDPYYNNTMLLMHVYGNMYDMGEAQGQLLGNELAKFINEVWSYLEQEGIDALPKWIPEWLAQDIIDFGGSLALDLTYLVTYKYTTKAYYTEMRAMVQAIGQPELFARARRVHMIGELTKGACSMFGAWGSATVDNSTIQLRALDWDFDGPFRKYPSITIYHPSSPKIGNTYANIGFTGWLGTLSGISDKQMAVSEIGVSYPDATFGKESRIGNPFTFVLRDVLQFDQNLEDSIFRMKNTERTCNLILGVGDGKPEVASFRGFQYSYSTLNVVDDQHLLPKNDTWHATINDIVYWGMDWECIYWDQRFNSLLNEFHGKIDAETTVRRIIPGLTSGNLQIVVYDLTNMNIYVAYGYMTEDKKYKVEAFDKAFVKLDMNKMFSEPPPK